MEKFNAYMINKFFTIPYFDRLVVEHNIPDAFVKNMRGHIRSKTATMGDAIGEIYDFMNCEYRNEYYYKNTILNQMLIQKHDLDNTAALTELPIGDSKADFITINGRGIVYEIKTDFRKFSYLLNP